MPDDTRSGRPKSHRDLAVWQKAMELVVDVYRLSDQFPKAELYRLTSQVTRAAVSIPSNIAEANARRSRKEYAHFLDIARGSAMETETLVMLGERLGYVSAAEAAAVVAKLTEISKMLFVLRKRIEP